MVGKGRFFVGGNWKCNETVEQAKKLVAELNAGDVPDDIEIVVAPTYIHLAMVSIDNVDACHTQLLVKGAYSKCLEHGWGTP